LSESFLSEMSDKRESNMEDKKPPQIVVAQQFIKDKSFITKDGTVIRNTPEEPNAVEEYLRSLRK
jgi:hypothetical protein